MNLTKDAEYFIFKKHKTLKEIQDLRKWNIMFMDCES